MDDDDDDNNYRAEFDEQHGILHLRVTNYEDIIKDDELTEEFLDCLLQGYHEAENSERKKHEKRLSWLKRL